MIIMALFASHKGILGGVILLLLAAIFAGMMRYSLKMGFGIAPDGMGRIAVAAPAMTAMGVSAVILIVGGIYLPPLANSVLQQAAKIVLGG